ncbi:type II toxin-antitoxin system VapC family toxin [Aurantimonas sp. A3-2-R12]|uniref:type II toxin-antitoxin system VapC family toxin n=1 Tax=Aurantimonas sp. A3-2-R12 TaxID=3114362 RepID=UPI002E1805F6|nr:PIN domain-containing protein [Aurantimonas sp. A3-2-R12]
MVVVDTNFLVLMIDPSSTQNTNNRVDRVRHFIAETSNTGEVVVIPSPVLAELVAGRTSRVEEIVETIRQFRVMEIQAFDTVIAIETGERIAAVQARIPEDQRLPGWKVAMKYDAMVAATALVRGARAIITTDDGFGKYLEGSSISMLRIDELPMPPEDPQGDMLRILP